MSDYAYRAEHGEPTAPVLALFHGTGGDRNVMFPLGEQVAPTWSKVSPEGKELEAGMYRRYFRRLAEGVLDEEDLIRRAHELSAWLPSMIEAEGWGDREIVPLGYSNGASIVAGMTVLGVGTWDRAILLRPMVPLRGDQIADLHGKKVLICASESDQITPIAGARELAERMTRAGAEVSFAALPGGHGLTRADVEAMQSWLGLA